MNAFSLASDTLLLEIILSQQYKEVSSTLNEGIIPPNIVTTNIVEKIINEGKIKFRDISVYFLGLRHNL